MNKLQFADFVFTHALAQLLDVMVGTEIDEGIISQMFAKIQSGQSPINTQFLSQLVPNMTVQKAGSSAIDLESNQIFLRATHNFTSVVSKEELNEAETDIARPHIFHYLKQNGVLLCCAGMFAQESFSASMSLNPFEDMVQQEFKVFPTFHECVAGPNQAMVTP